MLKMYIKRSISIVAAFVMFLALLSIEALAVTSTENVPAQTDSGSNIVLQELQLDLDNIMARYDIEKTMSNEEILAVVAEMDFEYRYALDEIWMLEERIATLVTSQVITDNEAQCFVESNPTFCTFAQALQDKYAADNSVIFLDTTVTVLDGKISITGTSTTSVSGNTVTATAKGGLMSQTTNNITITNSSGSTATISFSYSASNYSSFTNPEGGNSASGTYSVSLAAGGTVTLSIKGKEALYSNTATLTLNNFSLVAAAANPNVTIQFDSGTVTVGGTGVNNNDVKAISSSTGATIVATSTNFVGWIDTSTNQILSTSASFNLIPAADMTIKAIHGPTARFLIGTYAEKSGYLYETLSAATAAANSGSNKTVVLANNGTLSAGNYTIPSGVTLLIPYSDANIFRGVPTDWVLNEMSLTRNEFPDPPEESIVSAKVYKTTPNVEYRRLTMAEGAHITVNGSLEVSGQTHPLASGQWGNYAVLQMGSNTTITIGSTGTLYAYGYIRGNGTVTVASGGVVYEHYDVADYPPGGAGGLDPMNSAGVFGMTNYTFNSVEVPTTYNAGAELRAYLVMTGYNIGTNAFTRTFIGSDSEAIFNLKNRTITKTYSGGRQSFVIAGDIELNKLYIKIALVNYTVDSSQTSGLPISHNWDITVTNNSTVTLNGSLLMYAGSTLTVDNGSKIVIPSGIKLSLLDSESDPSAVTTNAVLDVNGEIQVDGGFYNSYTNTSIPIIKSSGGTGKVIVNNVGDETTFNVRASGDNYESVNITPAKLLNGDKTKYVETANETGTYTYYASTGRWDRPSHFYNEKEPVVTAPTCVDTGYTTHTCAVCGHSYTDSETPATGNHSYREGVQTTAPTCTTPGVMTYTCGVCSDSYTGDIIAAKIGDTEYKILSEAINAATASEIIFLQADIDGEVPVGKLLTINKNGCTADLKAENGFVITETGDDTVTSLIKIMATNVKAGDGLDLYFYILKSAWDSAFPSSQGQAAITREYADGKAPHTPESVAWLTDVEGYYRFRYSDIAAKEMTDPVSIVIRVGDITVSNTYTETIREYALRTFGTGTDELDTALMDMLNYGAAAQSYFGYNTENPANAKDDGGKIEQYAACATRNGTVTPENHLVKGDNLVAVSVSAKSKLMLTFYFENITTDMTAYITYTNHGGSEVTQTVNGSDFIEYNGWLGVDVTGLAIADGRQVVSCEVKNGEDVVASASDSVEGYIFRNYQEGNVVVLDMLMRFVDSAYKYFH